MPKYGIHTTVVQDTIAVSQSAVKDLLEQHRGTSLLGSIGPDLLFFSPEYGAFNFIMQVAQNLKQVKKTFGQVLDSIDKVLQPIEDALEQLVEPIDEAVETVEKVLPLECISGVVNDVKSASSTFEKALHETLMVGMEEGVDMIDDAADLPSFSHMMFDKLFTPGQQKGQREWNWYWFDMLHYRNSGLFAKNLVRLASSDIQQAYALGYLSHVATDVVGHAFVNRIVCGPYRLHPQRHVVIENFMDSFHYFQRNGVSVNRAFYRDLLSSMRADGVCEVDEYSEYVESFNPELRDLIYEAFRATYPNQPTTKGDPNPPRPDYLTKQDIETTFINFYNTMAYLRDAYVEKPEGLDERYAKVADTLNDILANFESPPSPPNIGNTRFCLEWECIENFFEHVAEWMSYFAELAKWTFDTIVNALDLLLEVFCEATVAVVRAIMYLTEYLCYELYQHMHFVLALNGYVCPDPSHAFDDPRGEILVHTGYTSSVLVGSCNVSVYPPICDSAYPRQHDCAKPAVKPPDAPLETPATFFPRCRTDDYPEYFISQAPWNGLEQTVKAYAEAATPADTRTLADFNRVDALELGNAVEFSSWMMQQALEIKAKEQTGQIHSLSHVVHCNWDLDSDRGYGYKQWFTNKNPTDVHDLDETYLDEDLSRD